MAILALIFSFTAYRVHKKQGKISSVIIMITTLIESVYKLIIVPGTGLPLLIILSLMAINGVRGTYAYHRLDPSSAHD